MNKDQLLQLLVILILGSPKIKRILETIVGPVWGINQIKVVITLITKRPFWDIIDLDDFAYDYGLIAWLFTLFFSFCFSSYTKKSWNDYYENRSWFCEDATPPENFVAETQNGLKKPLWEKLKKDYEIWKIEHSDLFKERVKKGVENF